MSINIDTFESNLNQVFTQIEKDQTEAISIEISANFIAGQTAAEKHKSIKSEDSDEEGGLTNEEKIEIAALVALYAGYISEFNTRAQAQIFLKVQALNEAGRSQDDIKQYIDDILSGKESIVIDNTGQERKEIYVDQDLKLSEVTRTVEKPFYSSVNSYASMIGTIAAHTAYEMGRKLYYKGKGYSQWVFTGPADERARAWHVALLGQAFTWGTVQSNYAEQCLHEPRCRHRAEVYYNDPSKDVPAEKWEQLKKDNGLFWNQEKETWDLK